MNFYQSLKQKYINFKENLGEAFSFFIYAVTTGRDYKDYIENKRDIERLWNRECELEHPKSADDVKLATLKGLLKRL